MKTKSLVLLTIVFAACGESKQAMYEGEWGLVSSTMQLVSDSIDPTTCPSGWTKLYEELSAIGQGHIVPLQRAYVKRFVNLENFKNASIEAKPLLDNLFPVFRLSLVWPCWQANESWQNEMVKTIEALQGAGWQIEITLLHHDSYPALLHTSDVKNSGWANHNAVFEFKNYVQGAVEKLSQILPKETRLFIANEPIAALWNGYLNPEGKWPPGGKNAPKSMAQAMINLRDGLIEAGKIVKAAGFIPVIAKNIRPLSGKFTDSLPAQNLDYIWNWWLLSALVYGCLDNNFDRVCEDEVGGHFVEEVSLTFYGTTEAKEETVSFGLSGGEEVEMALPNMNFAPNAQAFEKALTELFDRYALALKGIGVAEIGFSASRTDTMVKWLNWYRTVIARNEKPIAFVELHTLFESAEFSVGDWVFHLVEGCLSEPCQLTPWGEAIKKELNK